MTLVVHPHFHHRWSGVSAHTSALVFAQQVFFESRWLGALRPENLPGITFGEVLSRARVESVIWHAHRNNDLLLGFFLHLFFPKIKVIFTRHGSYPPSAFTRWIAKLAAQMITLNEENAGWMGRPSTVVPHGVDLKKFSPPTMDRKSRWASLQLGGSYGVGVVGRVRENKGQADFAAAIAPLLSNYPQWRAVLVGLIQPQHEAWARGLKENTAGALILAGEHRDIRPWYEGLTILVNPSHGESFGLTIIEGMAMGCCVVASKLFHVPGLIEHGRTGFLFEPKDVEGLRRILEELFQNPQRAVEVGQNAALEARQRFGVEREAQAIAQVYGKI